MRRIFLFLTAIALGLSAEGIHSSIRSFQEAISGACRLSEAVVIGQVIKIIPKSRRIVYFTAPSFAKRNSREYLLVILDTLKGHLRVDDTVSVFSVNEGYAEYSFPEANSIVPALEHNKKYIVFLKQDTIASKRNKTCIYLAYLFVAHAAIDTVRQYCREAGVQNCQGTGKELAKQPSKYP
jgi:hypothetical protein